MLNIENIILYLLMLPLVGVMVILYTPSWNTRLLKLQALYVSFGTFLISLLLWVGFDKSTVKFQFVDQIFWVPSLNLNLTVGIDGISLFLVILTTLLSKITLMYTM